MPYIRPKEPPFEKLSRLLKGYGLNGVKTAKIIGVSAPTAKKKLEDPELFTLKDLKKISVAVHIPIDEIREAITF